MRRIPFILSLTLMLAACGVKGPLKLPPPQAGTAGAPRTETPAPPFPSTAPAPFPFPPPAAKTAPAEAVPSGTEPTKNGDAEEAIDLSTHVIDSRDDQ